MRESDLARRVRSVLARLGGFRHRAALERRFEEERRFHVAMETERNVAAGMAPEEAHRAALVAFGGAERFREEARDEMRSRLIEELVRDVKFSIRSLRRTPLFAFAAIASLALGIGAATVIYSITDHVVLRPLAYPDADRLVLVREVVDQFREQMPDVPANASHYLAWRARCTACADVAALRTLSLTLRGEGDPQRVPSARVSANLLPMLGARAQIGRLFTEADDREGAEHVVLLSDALWRRQFGARRDVVGTTIGLGSLPYTVIGVLAPAFHLPSARELGGASSVRDDGLVIPLALDQRERTTMGEFDYVVIARLAPRATTELARAQIESIERELSARRSDRATIHARVEPLLEHVLGSSAQALLLLLAAVGALLLIVCVNLANLVLARGAARAHESAVRVALGAGRGRLLRQALTESVVLALIGGALGTMLSAWGLGALLRFAPPTLPRASEIRLDARVLVVSLLVTLVAGVVIGIVPALRRAAADPADTLKSSSWRSGGGDRRAARVREMLVVAQVGVSALLLAGAGLLLASFVRVLHVDRGFSVEHTLAIDLHLPPNEYPAREARTQLIDAALRALGAIPGVSGSALATALPLEGDSQMDDLAREHETRAPAARPIASIRYVSPSYFDVMATRVREGRAFTDEDRARRVAVISARTARALWGSDEPIGQRFWPGSNDTLSEVVGVVDDIHTVSLEREGTLVVYVPYWQRPPATSTLLLRTASDPRSVAASARAALHLVAPSAPVARVRTMESVLSAALAQRRFQLVILGLFAATALATASVGVYGVVSQSVTRRRNELGVRIALGAQPADIRALVLREGLTPVAIGIAVGLVAAMMMSRAIRALLFQVSPSDPMTMGSVALLLLGVAALACWVPARRATHCSIGSGE